MPLPVMWRTLLNYPSMPKPIKADHRAYTVYVLWGLYRSMEPERMKLILYQLKKKPWMTTQKINRVDIILARMEQEQQLKHQAVHA